MYLYGPTNTYHNIAILGCWLATWKVQAVTRLFRLGAAYCSSQRATGRGVVDWHRCRAPSDTASISTAVSKAHHFDFEILLLPELTSIPFDQPARTVSGGSLRKSRRSRHHKLGNHFGSFVRMLRGFSSCVVSEQGVLIFLGLLDFWLEDLEFAFDFCFPVQIWFFLALLACLGCIYSLRFWGFFDSFLKMFSMIIPQGSALSENSNFSKFVL